MRILVVDDEQIVRESLFHWFKKSGHTVDTASSGFEALKKLELEPFETIFADIKMPGMDGLELLDKIKEKYPETIVIIITAHGSIESAIQAMKTGASDYLLKPFKPELLSLVMEKISHQKRLESDYRYLRGHLEQITRFDNIIGESRPMRDIFNIIPEVSKSDSSILLTGETGTGKELIAKAIHAKSNRSKRPFIAINCGAIPDSLLESELFGHKKGAFTGAIQSRKGFLEVVSGGTLFLDEIGEISSKMQIDLLRVLEEKKVTRMGTTQSIDVDFRLISATRRDLEKEIAKDNFREDFFYRVNVINIHIPPLRKRKDDIPLLINHFLEKYSQETSKRVDHLSQEALERLTDYKWPGNIRELENAVERAVVLSKSRTLHTKDFPFLRASSPALSKMSTLLEMEKSYILESLGRCNWNITQASKNLGINRVTLHKKINRYNLKKPA